jgi:hypothetical protein
LRPWRPRSGETSLCPTGARQARARGDGKVLLVEGDGSLMMDVQELETIRRQGIRLLMAIMNDGGYGADAHNFRANMITPRKPCTAAATSPPPRRASGFAAPQ